MDARGECLSLFYSGDGNTKKRKSNCLGFLFQMYQLGYTFLIYKLVFYSIIG